MAPKGYKLSIETRLKISKNHADFTGNKNPMWGKKRPKYIGKAVAKANKKRVWTDQARQRIAEAGRRRKGKDNSQWKGDEVGYTGLHRWVDRELGKPANCSKCGSLKNVQWANKDHKYKRNLEDWMRLCAKCHRQYDKKLIDSIKIKYWIKIFSRNQL